MRVFLIHSSWRGYPLLEGWGMIPRGDDCMQICCGSRFSGFRISARREHFGPRSSKHQCHLQWYLQGALRGPKSAVGLLLDANHAKAHFLLHVLFSFSLGSPLLATTQYPYRLTLNPLEGSRLNMNANASIHMPIYYIMRHAHC